MDIHSSTSFTKQEKDAAKKLRTSAEEQRHRVSGMESQVANYILDISLLGRELHKKKGELGETNRCANPTFEYITAKIAIFRKNWVTTNAINMVTLWNGNT